MLGGLLTSAFIISTSLISCVERKSHEWCLKQQRTWLPAYARASVLLSTDEQYHQQWRKPENCL